MDPLGPLSVHERTEDKLWSKHGISAYEVEEACSQTSSILLRGRKGTYTVLGQTDEGRYITCILVWRDDAWWIVMARDMTSAERQRYLALRDKGQ